MVLGKLSVPGRPTNLDYSLRLQKVRVGTVWTFFLSSILFLFSLPLSGTERNTSRRANLANLVLPPR